MKPAPFEYHVAYTIEDALQRLSETADEGGRILAGGQSLIPMMALRVAYPSHLIDINRIDDLLGVEEHEAGLKIKALTRHRFFEKSDQTSTTWRLLRAVAHHIAHYPIREKGTFCGSVAHADPSSEWCLVAATLDGNMELASSTGRRSVAAEEFFQGIMTTAIEPNEMLLSVTLPLLSDQTRFGFEEFNRRAGDFAIAMSLVTLELLDNRLCSVRIGLGGVEAFARRMKQVEEMLEGHEPSPYLIEQAARLASEQVDPLEDSQIDAQYRRDLTYAMVRRAITKALN